MNAKRIVQVIFVFSLILITFFPTLAFAELFPVPPIDEEVAFVFLVTPVKKEKFINKKWGLKFINTYSIEHHKRITTPEGDKILMIMEGVERDCGPYKVVLEFIEKDGKIQQTRFLKELYDFSGNNVLTYDVDFKNMDHVFPPDRYTSEINTLLLRGIDISPKSKFHYYWWASERSVIPMYTKVKKPREITVKAGTFKCYPIDIFMNVADFVNKGDFLNSVINPFLPDITMYFDVNPPHYFVYYKGPIGPPGSPEANLELVKIVKGKEEIEKVRKKVTSPDLYGPELESPVLFE